MSHLLPIASYLDNKNKKWGFKVYDEGFKVYEEEGYEGKLNSFKVKDTNSFKEMRIKRKTPDVVEISFKRPTKRAKLNSFHFIK